MKPMSFTSVIASITSFFLPLLPLAMSASLPDSCCSIQPFKDGNLDELLQEFDHKVCQLHCDVSMAKFEEWGQASVIEPIISSILEKMGLPEVHSITHQITVETATAVKDTCLKGNGAQNLCQDQVLKSFGQCLKEHLVSIVISKVEPYAILIDEDMCKTAKEYIEGKDLWTRVIPEYLEEYAAKCKST